MSNQPKPKFTKVKIKPSLAYREIESTCQKIAPSDPKLVKELQIKESKWHCKMSEITKSKI